MNYYIIGIGGTGAKVMEAFSYLCAAGLMPEGNLSALFIDPDVNNGNVIKAKNIFTNYKKCSEIDTDGGMDFFKTKMSLEPDIWSPFQTWQNPGEPQLDNFFLYNSLKSEEKYLFDTLYSYKEKNTTLEKGFRGHPSIGAAVFAKTIPTEDQNPWKDFYNSIGKDLEQGCKIFIVGSIFGGTGASGLPTIAKLIRNKYANKENIILGGLIVLPYFSFIPPTVDSELDNELHANSNNFLLSTKAALDYYYNQENSFNSIYLLGDDESPPMKRFAIGAGEQRNEPHLVELIGALMAIDFFKNKTQNNYHCLGRASQNYINWEDLKMRDKQDDKTKESENWEYSLIHFTRFAFVYLHRFLSQFEDIEKHKKPERYSWYWELFKENSKFSESRLKEKRKPISEFCHSYLDWMAKVVNSIPEKSIRLINYSSFAEKKENQINLLCQSVNDMIKYNFIETQFGGLDKFGDDFKESEIKNVYEKMCRPVVSSEKSKEFGRFLIRLSNAAEKERSK